MPYQPGDRRVILGGEPHRLRLTLSGLAEISDRLNAGGPLGLSQEIRRDSKASFAVILEVLLQSETPLSWLEKASGDEMIKAAEAASNLISEVFSNE